MNRAAIFVFGILFFFNIPLTAETCAFCNPKIIEQQRVLECQFFHVLLDYMPRIDGHLLVIPKRHIVKAHELSNDEWAELGDIFPKITKVFSEFLGTEDYILLEKNGRNAFQQVPHVHFHLFPIRDETWSSIFDIAPKRLKQETLEKQVLLFQRYFKGHL